MTKSYYILVAVVLRAFQTHAHKNHIESNHLYSSYLTISDIQIEDAYLNDCMSININQLINFIDNMRINAPYATLTYYHNGNQITGSNYFQLMGNIITVMQGLGTGTITVVASEAGYTDKTVSLHFTLSQYIPVFSTPPAPLYIPCQEQNQSYNLSQAEIKAHLKQFLVNGANLILELNMIGGFSILNSGNINFEFRVQGETCWSHNFSLHVIRINKPVIDTLPDNFYTSNCENTFTVTEQMLQDSFGATSIYYGYEIKYNNALQTLNQPISLTFSGNGTTGITVEFYYLSSPQCRATGMLTIQQAPQINLNLNAVQDYLDSNVIQFCDGDDPAQKVNTLISYINSQLPGVITDKTTQQIIEEFTNTTGNVTVTLTMPLRCGHQTVALTYIKNSIPILSNVVPVIICSGNVAVLTAVSNIGSISWYASETDTLPIAQGTGFTTSPLFSDTVFWAEAANNGCISQRVAVSIEVRNAIVPQFTAVPPVCSGSTMPALPSISLNGISGTCSPALNNTVTTTYTFTPTAGQCAETSTLTITVNTILLSSESYPAPLKECDDNNDGIALFNLENVEHSLESVLTENTAITFHESLADAGNNQNAIQLTIYSNNPAFTVNGIQKVWIRIQSAANGCSLIIPLELKIYTTPQAYPIVNNALLTSCTVFNLTIAGNEALGNQDVASYSVTYYTTSLGAQTGIINSDDFITDPISYISSEEKQQLWVRIENKANDACYAVTSFHIWNSQIVKPKITSNRGNAICIDYRTNKVIEPITLHATTSGKNISFEWYKNNVSIPNAVSELYTVTEEGNYTVKAIGTEEPYCTSEISESFNVIASGPAVAIGEGFSVEPFANQNSVEIQVEGYGEYNYSFSENGPWQDSPFFENIMPGIYTVYVKDIKSDNDCGMLIIRNVAVISYPKFFTPNNDGINDFWSLDDYNVMENSNLYIFDRYGKLLKELIPSSNNWLKKTWDGTYNGKSVPSGDYWFKVVFTYNGKPYEYKSHFSLLR